MDGYSMFCFRTKHAQCLIYVLYFSNDIVGQCLNKTDIKFHVSYFHVPLTFIDGTDLRPVRASDSE